MKNNLIKNNLNILFLDTETGGLDIEKDSLLQIGLVAYKDGKIVDKLELSLKEDVYHVTAEAMKFNGLNLYEDVYKNGQNEKDAIMLIKNFILHNFFDNNFFYDNSLASKEYMKSRKPILAGHNPSLDKYMLRKLFDNNNENMDNYISYRMIDTMSIIWALYSAGKLPIEACSSSGAFEYFNITVKNRHHAIDDCIATAELYEKLINML